MSAPSRRDGAPRLPAEDGPKDEEFAGTYAAGYGEGVRSALREVLGHASRGHTTAELRMLIESRLARLPEEVELKRRSMLAPPRQPAWASLLRPPVGARPWLAPIGTPPPVVLRVTTGGSLLIREERPRRALDLLHESATQFPRVVLLSLHPPELPELRPEQRIVIPIISGGDGPDRVAPGPGEIGGRLREPTEAPGGALVYLDALEFLATEHSLETTLRFVQWLGNQVSTTGSALLASVDARALDLKEMSRLERAFQSVA
ncbi:MAG: DUF835 domain-containing protein [Thermoplasmata archaeon]|nr:DUF835 domain-containing protein [Thermoplasmata archaeon]